MYLAEKTVKNYVSNLLMKLGMDRRTEAAVYAARLADDDAPRWGHHQDPSYDRRRGTAGGRRARPARHWRGAVIRAAAHRGLGPIGDQLDDASGAQAAEGVAGDHVGGHGQDEADDAAEQAAEGGDDEHDERVDVEGAAHDLGLDEVLEERGWRPARPRA